MSERLDRREFVRRTAGWTAFFCASPLGGRWVFAGTTDASSPIDEAPDFTRTKKPGILPFCVGFQGDSFHRPHQAIVNSEPLLKKLHEPDEKVAVAVVGGGISGLTSAYLLRDLKPVLLEADPRFGGNSKGERWRGSTYATGAAYFIKPDEGDEIDTLYKEIGAMEGARLLEGADPVEHQGKLYAEFFKGESSPDDAAQFEIYRTKMHEYAENYPDIPITEEEGRELVLALDRRSLADVVTEWLGGKVPAPLQAALQNYCWSSLGAGWGELSAAAAINFLAGEEFGVMAQPGGNAWVARALHDRLREAAGAERARAGCVVFQVRPVEGGVRVAYLDPTDSVRVLEAKAVVLACPKFVVNAILPDLETERKKAIEALRYRAYLVVNVLLRSPVDHDFYDLYLLRDGSISKLPGGEGRPPGRVTDVIIGNWARKPSAKDESVLTLYWPMPFDGAREDLFMGEDAWSRLQPRAEKQILEILPILGLKPDAVEQVRMARWGHALPVASVGFIADGHADVLRRPFSDRVFFVNQDNWALPAIETAITEALHFAPLVREAVS